MINQVQAGHIRASTTSMLNTDALGMPETGEFDFLNYLLGLQAETTEPGLDNLLGTAEKSESGSKTLEGSDKALLDLFESRKELENPGLQLQASQLLKQPENTLIIGKPNLKDMGPVKEDFSQFDMIKESKLPVKTDLNQLEDPLTKVAFEMAVAKQSKAESKAEVFTSRELQASSRQQRERLLQAFQTMPREVTPDHSARMAEVTFKSEGTSENGFSIDKLDRPKKKTEESIDWVMTEAKGDVNFQDNGISLKENTSLKASHVPVPDVFQKVESLAYQGGGKMTVMLTPPELGQVEIHVSTKGKNVEVSVKSDNDFAKAAIESQVADLQQSLQNQDLNLSKIEVHVSREMDPSFLENQFAGFSRQGNFQQQSEGYRQDSRSEKAWNTNNQGGTRLSGAGRSLNGVQPLRTAYRTESRVDIRI